MDILELICTLIAVILGLIVLLIIILDKTCHTVAMMLVANSFLIQLVVASDLFGLALFKLQNDRKQIQFYNTFCIFGGYMTYVTTAIQMYSYLLQAIYRYITVLYPTHLFWQSTKFQAFLICLSWLCGIIYPIPVAFTNQIQYHVDDQICQVPLSLSVLMIFNCSYIYVVPLVAIMVIYIKVVRYVKEMGKRVTSANTLLRAQRELRMIRRIIILVFLLLSFGMPYVLFLIMSFFNRAPKYHFRIAYIFLNSSLALIVITLFEISDPLKASVMRRITGELTRINPTVT